MGLLDLLILLTNVGIVRWVESGKDTFSTSLSASDKNLTLSIAKIRRVTGGEKILWFLEKEKYTKLYYIFKITAGAETEEINNYTQGHIQVETLYFDVKEIVEKRQPIKLRGILFEELLKKCGITP